MIRINLLPFRLARKKENIRRQITVFFLLIFLTVIVLFWVTLTMNRLIADVQERTRQINKQIPTYKEKADRVTKIQRDLKILNDKLNVVASLNNEKDKQLVLFDSLTELIIPGKMWLHSLSTNSTTVQLKGTALDNQTIADFLRRLEASPLFGNVDLKTSQLKDIKDFGKFKEFDLVCQKLKKNLVPQKEQGKK